MLSLLFVEGILNNECDVWYAVGVGVFAELLLDILVGGDTVWSFWRCLSDILLGFIWPLNNATWLLSIVLCDIEGDIVLVGDANISSSYIGDSLDKLVVG